MAEQHEPTFEVGPIEPIEGVPVRLVYTRMKDRPTDVDLRCHALAWAVQAEQYAFRKDAEENDSGSRKAQYVVETAAAFLAFLDGGES